MKLKIRPIILCGGTGTRLWPESRSKLPKQFIPMSEGKTLFDLTLMRLKKIKNTLKPIIVTNEKYKFLVKDALFNQNLDSKIILEPSGRNTAPAIFIASKISNEDETLIIMPSDHYIGKVNIFINKINEILTKKFTSKWVTFGITPNQPSTSYGYIQLKDQNKKNLLYEVKNFIEKPELKKAKKFFQSKNYFWNSGIFIGNAKMIVDSIKQNAPSISKKCDEAIKYSTFCKTKDEYSFVKKIFEKIPSISIDISVIEKSSNVLCCPINCDWNDVGSWNKYFECFPPKNNSEQLIQIDSKNNFIKTKNKLITTIGVENLIIVDNQDALLIAKRGLEQKMTDLISLLRKNKFKELEDNVFENRPWGKFENIFISNNLKIKTIIINPKARISKQFHNHRSEHWFITKGKASIFKDGKIINLSKGQSIDIPKKCTHYIENQTRTTLEFVEIQMGTYFGEDDIVRVEDIYDRK